MEIHPGRDTSPLKEDGRKTYYWTKRVKLTDRNLTGLTVIKINTLFPLVSVYFLCSVVAYIVFILIDGLLGCMSV